MFKKIGFELLRDEKASNRSPEIVYYRRSEDGMEKVYFSRRYKHVTFEWHDNIYEDVVDCVDMETLKCVVEQCKELGWLS